MQPDIRVYGIDTCAGTERTRRHLDERGVVYTYINLDKDEDADRKVREWNHGFRLVPTVVICRDGRTRCLAGPDGAALDAALAEDAAPGAGLRSVA